MPRKRFKKTRRLSDQISIAVDHPDIKAHPKGKPERFVEDTKRALELFPSMREVPTIDAAPDDLTERARSIYWYHTIELPGVTTTGMFDHRPLVPHYGIPDNLSGKRALDVGTWDGFWAFEMEKRGAAVSAIDVEGLHEVDLPDAYKRSLDASRLKQYYSHGFELARQALGSSVDRRSLNVYDLSPESMGTFDVVHMGDLLLHLEYPTKALRNVRSVTGERAVICAPFEPDLEPDEVRYLGGWWNVVWWIPSIDAAAQMIYDAGFSTVDLNIAYELQGPGEPRGYWRAVFTALP